MLNVDYEGIDDTPEIVNDLNKDDNTLPFGYMNPETEGKLTWICAEDAQGNITSVFCFDTGNGIEKKVAHLSNLDEAIYMKDELISNGWSKLKAPEIRITYPGVDGDKPLNRAQRRTLQQKLKRAARKQRLDDNI